MKTTVVLPQFDAENKDTYQRTLRVNLEIELREIKIALSDLFRRITLLEEKLK